MKLLTVFSTFFLHLKFIAGIYGINFNNMPQLTWENDYFITLLIMLIVALIIYQSFKSKKKM